MRNLDEFLDKVKDVTGSDYKTSKSIGIANQLIGNWRGKISMPSNKHVIEMCKLANIDLGKAIIAVEYSRENERPLKQAGFGNVAFLSSLSVGGFGAMSIMNMTQLPYESIGAWALSSLPMYIMLNSNHPELSEVKGQLRTLSHEELLKFVAANDIEACQVSTHRIY